MRKLYNYESGFIGLFLIIGGIVLGSLAVWLKTASATDVMIVVAGIILVLGIFFAMRGIGD